MSPATDLLQQTTAERHCAPLLPLIAAQAAQADAGGSIDPAVIAAIKQSDLISLAAAPTIGGLDASVTAIALELEAIAAACGSTAWCLWNHLAVFHCYCEQLGPAAAGLLAGIVRDRAWCCFPQGAGSGVRGRRDGDDVLLTGKATFGSGARYAQWTASVFAVEPPPGEQPAKADLRFTVLPLAAPGVAIDPTWQAMSLRASATDTVHYQAVRVPLANVRTFNPNNAAVARRPETPVLAPRYHEDWVAQGVLWLAAQATGIARAALREACAAMVGRVDIGRVNVATRPSVQAHTGEAAALVAAARSVVLQGCAETDARLSEERCPTEADQLRQLSQAMASIRLCDQAMGLLLRVQGGTALRQEGSFERRYRDFQAIPLHITAHPDRVAEAVGRYLLQQETAPLGAATPSA